MISLIWSWEIGDIKCAPSTRVSVWYVILTWHVILSPFTLPLCRIRWCRKLIWPDCYKELSQEPLYQHDQCQFCLYSFDCIFHDESFMDISLNWLFCWKIAMSAALMPALRALSIADEDFIPYHTLYGINFTSLWVASPAWLKLEGEMLSTFFDHIGYSWV